MGHGGLILDHERIGIMRRNSKLNCADIKIALLVIMHTIAPVNFTLN